MAERRMFAKTIIDSDAFLDMPLSTQALYFHLSMRADDDGFVNNSRKIQRMVGASDDDFKLLLAKRFILVFDSGVIVIKHWKIHNYIQTDRYKETVYKEEKALLSVKDNKSYTLDTECIHDGYRPYTQDRIGKDRLGEDRVGKDRLEEESIVELSNESSSKCTEETSGTRRADYKAIVDLYNSICVSFPMVSSISESRKKAIKARMNTYNEEDFETLFRKAEASSFLKGANDRNWRATFDWLLKDANMAKVLDGNYDDRKKSKGTEKTVDMINRFMERMTNDDSGI